jgi:hypothetical protein
MVFHGRTFLIILFGQAASSSGNAAPEQYHFYFNIQAIIANFIDHFHGLSTHRFSIFHVPAFSARTLFQQFIDDYPLTNANIVA